MVDIETMGTKSYSAILSIGVVAFDLKTGELGDEFYQTISLDSCLRNGLRTDPKTIAWWKTQDKKVFKELTKNTSTLPKVLIKLNRWLVDSCRTTKYMWGNAASFDLGLLTNAYEKCQLEPAWAYWNERCCRTIVALNPDIKNSMPKPTGVHHPIVDCKYQIDYVVKTINSF